MFKKRTKRTRPAPKSRIDDEPSDGDDTNEAENFHKPPKPATTAQAPKYTLEELREMYDLSTDVEDRPQINESEYIAENIGNSEPHPPPLPSGSGLAPAELGEHTLLFDSDNDISRFEDDHDNLSPENFPDQLQGLDSDTAMPYDDSFEPLQQEPYENPMERRLRLIREMVHTESFKPSPVPDLTIVCARIDARLAPLRAQHDELQAALDKVEYNA